MTHFKNLNHTCD